MKDELNPPSHSDFENFFINNIELNKIEAYLNRFNPIHIMKMENQEIRHSNILGWLLDPLNTHGLGDKFLKAFLTEALKGESLKGGLTSLQILQADLRDTQVKREWNHIDILLLSPKNNFAFVIENKFKSKQYKGQLKQYIDKIKNIYKDDYPDLIIKGIFLTLHNEEPEDLSYATIGYDNICEILPSILDIQNTSTSLQVKTFIEHYIDTLKEATGMSEHAKEMERIAKSLYRQHQKLIDFIWEHGSSNEFNLALDELLGENWEDKNKLTIKNIEITEFWSNGNLFCFLPLSWLKILKNCNSSWDGCENWWNTYPLICWIELRNGENSSGTLRLFAEVGPLNNYEDRLSMINSLKKISENEKLSQISFQKTATDHGSKYSNFFKGNTIKIDDVQDIDEISRKVSKLFENFELCFDKIAIALKHFKQDRYST